MTTDKIIRKEMNLDCSDIIEILLIHFGHNSNVLFGDCQSVISRLSKPTDNIFLNTRGLYLRENIVNDSTRWLFTRLESLYCTKNPNCSDCPINKYCNEYIDRQTRENDLNQPTYVDLFCGAGGLSLGFRNEHYTMCFANDIDPICIETYSHNHPEVPRKYIVRGDINTLLESIHQYIKYPVIDLVIGGPPCQGFSMANRQRILDDPRNALYKSFVKVVHTLNPLFFVMENVKGMLSVKEQVIDNFIEIGYQVNAEVLNAKDFGIPQNRERIFFIGNRIGVDSSEVFSAIHAYSEMQTEYTLRDALFGLPPLTPAKRKNDCNTTDINCGKKIAARFHSISNSYINSINIGIDCPIIYNHQARFNNTRDIEIYRRLFPGDNSTDAKIADIMPYTNRSHIFQDKYYKLDENKICKTITAHMKYDCNMYIHPTESRGLSPREAARVQSYPDNYFFKGPLTKTYMQIGNSVPPKLSRAIACVLKKYIMKNGG